MLMVSVFLYAVHALLLRDWMYIDDKNVLEWSSAILTYYTARGHEENTGPRLAPCVSRTRDRAELIKV